MSLDAETTNFLILMDKYLDDEVVMDIYLNLSKNATRKYR